jgi:hypothetical protein
VKVSSSPFSFSQPNNANFDPIRGCQNSGLLTVGYWHVISQGWIKHIGNEPRKVTELCQVGELRNTEVKVMVLFGSALLLPSE